MTFKEFVSSNQEWHEILEYEPLYKLVDVEGMQHLHLAVNCWVVAQLRCNVDVLSRLEEVAVIMIRKCESGSPGIAWRGRSLAEREEVAAIVELAAARIIDSTSLHMIIDWLSVSRIDWAAMQRYLSAGQ